MVLGVSSLSTPMCAKLLTDENPQVFLATGSGSGFPAPTGGAAFNTWRSNGSVWDKRAFRSLPRRILRCLDKWAGGGSEQYERVSLHWVTYRKKRQQRVFLPLNIPTGGQSHFRRDCSTTLSSSNFLLWFSVMDCICKCSLKLVVRK